MVNQGELQLSVRDRKALWVASDMFGGSTGEDLSNLPVTVQASHHTSQDQRLSLLASSVMLIRFQTVLRKLGFTASRFF